MPFDPENFGPSVQRVLAAHPRRPAPAANRSPWAHIISALERGEIDQREAERQLDLIPEAKGMRLTRKNAREGWHEAEDKKRRWGKDLAGMGLTVAGGVAGGELTGLLNAGPKAATLGSFAPAAYQGGAGTPIGLGQLAGQTAGAAGAAGTVGSTAAGAGSMASKGGSMVPEALIGGGFSLLSSLLSGRGGGSFDDVKGEQKRFVNPTDSLYNALRSIATLGLGQARQVQTPRQLPSVPLTGGRQLPTPLGTPGLNTASGGGQPDLVQFFQNLLNPVSQYGPDAVRTDARRDRTGLPSQVGWRDETGEVQNGNRVRSLSRSPIDPSTGQPFPIARRRAG